VVFYVSGLTSTAREDCRVRILAPAQHAENLQDPIPYGPKTKTTLDLASQRAENGIPQFGFHIRWSTMSRRSVHSRNRVVRVVSDVRTGDSHRRKGRATTPREAAEMLGRFSMVVAEHPAESLPTTHAPGGLGGAA